MKTAIKVIVTKEVEVSTVHIEAWVRYWEDTMVNGAEDIDGRLIPCRDDGWWKPIIDIESGRITNWTPGFAAEVHYKVCDQCCFYLYDRDGMKQYSYEDGYVPAFLYPKENGFGDYIIMDINSEGFISNWNPKKIEEALID